MKTELIRLFRALLIMFINYPTYMNITIVLLLLLLVVVLVYNMLRVYNMYMHIKKTTEKQVSESQEKPVDIEKENFEENNQTTVQGKYDKFLFLIPIILIIIAILIGNIIDFIRQ